MLKQIGGGSGGTWEGREWGAVDTNVRRIHSRCSSECARRPVESVSSETLPLTSETNEDAAPASSRMRKTQGRSARALRVRHSKKVGQLLKRNS